jgi:HK97 gp10 family phage protein
MGHKQMTKEFNSFGAFAAHLLTRVAATQEMLHLGLRHIAHEIEKTAKEEIGVYQPEVGPFPAWAPLSEFTVEDRIAQGYSPDEPLLREGTLRDSISNEVHGLEAAIGSTSEIAVYQELGTDKIPPRPFLGPAAYRNEKTIINTTAAAAVAGIAGGNPLQEARRLGFKIEGE